MTAEYAAAIADAFLESHYELLGPLDPHQDLKHGAAVVDRLGMAHVEYQQWYLGVRVLHGGLTVHLDRAGNAAYVKTKLVDELPTTVTPVVSRQSAEQIALQRARGDAQGIGLKVESTDLVIFPLG